ncbi:hypothetical protein Cgig2_013219 [Carnegiea gigantea]|uniref:Tail-anchored protein insertion receptor WRB n=1 Tax=Carnegiea gigantea TaxID=171969 RepID=A0A9Q1KP08_9CARY|nr:hypothetical protein Cgig2_013219 [Carnegiea gigantea]
MEEVTGRLVAPMIFIIIALVECVSKYVELLTKNGGAMSDEEKKLREEIKQLLKEASTLTQPSTFAQAAKLRRMAAAKEKKLAKYQKRQMMERKSSYDPYMKYVTPVKALTYLVLGVWVWKSSMASVPRELVQPIGGILSFRSSARSKDKVMVHVYGNYLTLVL